MRKVRQRSGGQRGRRWLLLPFGAAAGVLSVVALAWACTPTQGVATVSPTSVGLGGTVTVSAAGAVASLDNWNLRFASQADLITTACHDSNKNIGPNGVARPESDASGNIPSTSGTVPTNPANVGTGQVCFENKPDAATIPAALTVTAT